MPSKIEADAQPRRTWSLAALLTGWFALAAFALLALATSWLYWSLEDGIAREDLGQLEERARFFEEALVREDTPDLSELRWESEWLARQPVPMYLRIADHAGGVLVETSGLASLGLSSLPAATDGIARVERGGRQFFVLRRALHHPRAASLVLVLDETDDRDFLESFRLRMSGVLAFGLLAATALGFGLARLGLRPLERIADTARRVQLADLTVRIDPHRFPAELAELAATFNAMLARLEEAAERLSQFSADMAHEVRTPLTVLQGQIELALRSERSPTEYRDVLAANLEECETLTRLIDRLLFLARTEDPATQVERAELELLPFLRDMVEFYGPLADERRIVLTAVAPDRAVAVADRALLQRAVGNLLENALRHTPEGGMIDVGATLLADEVSIEVSDTGPGIPPEAQPFLFDRFFRGDRSPRARGVGLGLAIVKRVATLHGGSVIVSSEPGKGARFTLRLPRASGRDAVPT